MIYAKDHPFQAIHIKCAQCATLSLRGRTHRYVAAVLVHPNQKVVIPLAIEPIVKQDGETKNDCERNATRRLLRRIRSLYPQLKLIVIEDGLSSNAPHIADLQKLKMRYLLGAKPADHAHLFNQVFATGGRCRWRIENETFNTLENQGYHFEHNYGHGKQNLSTVFMLLMFLAFLVDQVHGSIPESQSLSNSRFRQVA